MVKIALIHITFLDVSFASSVKVIPALTLNYRVFARGTGSGSDASLLVEWGSHTSEKDHPKWPERFRAEIECYPHDIQISLKGFKKMAAVGNLYCNSSKSARQWVELHNDHECIGEIHLEYSVEDLEPRDLQEDRHLVPKLCGLQCKTISDHNLEFASAYGTFWINQLEKLITVKNIYTIHANDLFYVQIWYQSKSDKKPCLCHPDGSSDTAHNVYYV